MNFTKNWKRFWNLSRRSEGFTLVELIVVIAILAILAGVATVGYSGYVKKANQAADLDTLYAINTAFAAACIQNGTDTTLVSSAAIDLATGDLTKVGSLDATKLASVNTAFDQLFGTGEIKFKTITGLLFDAEKHQFVDAKSESIKIAYGGGYITVSGEAAELLSNSTWGTVGADGMLNKVASVTDYFAGSGFDVKSLKSDDAYMTVLGNALGTDLDGAHEIIDTAWVLKVEELSALYGDTKTSDEIQEMAMKEVLANATVLSVAQSSANQDNEAVLELLSSGSAKSQLAANVGNNATSGLSQTAMAYALYTAYAHSEYGNETAINNASSADAMTVINALDSDDGFQTYLGTEQAQEDLEAYMAAMEMIGSSSKDENAVSTLLTDGYADSELIKILEQMMGN